MVEQEGGLAGTARGEVSDGVEAPPVSPLPHHRGLWLKHTLDRVAAAFGLLVTAPVFIGIALALRFRGPVLVRLDRTGEGGRPVLVRSFAITEELCRSRAWRLVASTGATALPQLWSVL